MRKKLLKIILPLLLVTALFLCCGFSALAKEETPTEEIETRDITSDDTGNEANDNVFDTAYALISDNGDKILSLLSFLGTLFIAFTYKKGLLPRLRSALSGFSETVSELKADTEKTGSDVQSCNEELSRLAVITGEMSAELKRLDEDLTASDRAGERRIMTELMTEQVSLLADIFMSSSLPEYKKEEVGVRLNRLKEALRNEEPTDE